MTAYYDTAVRTARPVPAPGSGDNLRPDVAAANCPADFIAAMRQLKEWAGLSYRQLETRASRIGRVLPRSTLTTALHRDRLPRGELVVTFVRACGCDEEEANQWLATRLRLAASIGPAVAPPHHPEAARAGSAFAALLLPPLWYRADRSTRALIRALVAVVVLVAVAVSIW